MEDSFKRVIRDYFRRLSVLTTQVPYEVRVTLLPQYMMYNGFKAVVHFDPTGRIGFEILREKGGRLSIKARSTNGRIETEIFGVLGQENMLFLGGHNAGVIGGVLTCEDFAKRFENEIPKRLSRLKFAKSGSIGPFEIGEEAECKIIGVTIYWIVNKRRWVKYIPFAWVFGNSGYFAKIDPVLHAETDFYSSLFGSLYRIVTRDYEKFSKDTKLRVRTIYMDFLGRAYSEVKDVLSRTQADEQVFQRLLTKYKFFLSPEAVLIESQPTLDGKQARRPDFHILTPKKENIYVEIEPPSCKPFEGLRESTRLRGALEQVSEWQKVLLDRAEETSDIRYLVVIGFLDDLTDDEKKTLEAFNNSKKDLKVQTWDWILQNIDSVRRDMESMLPIS